MKTKQIHLYIRDELHSRVKALAAKEKKSISAVITKFLDEWVDEDLYKELNADPYNK